MGLSPGYGKMFNLSINFILKLLESIVKRVGYSSLVERLWVLLVLVGCTTVGYIPLQDKRGIQHLYKEEIRLLHFQKVTRYCATHHAWEKIQAVWDDSTYIYYTTRGS